MVKVKSRYNKSKSIKRRQIIKNKNITKENIRIFQDLMSTGSDDISGIRLQTGRGKSRRRSSRRRSSRIR